jgi:GGDEF domain-containing protein
LNIGRCGTNSARESKFANTRLAITLDRFRPRPSHRHRVGPQRRGGRWTVDVQASVGVAYANRPDVSSDELVGHADTAMYESKRNGRGRPVTCVPGLSAA